MVLNINILKNIVKSGEFDLTRITELIEKGYVAGAYSAEEREELLKLRNQYLKPESQTPEMQEVLKRLEEKYAALEARVIKLEKNGSEESETTEDDEYPAWHPWNGIPGTGYAFGAKCSHFGFKYVSNYQGENTWEPGVLGTEAIWIKVQE